MPTARVNTFHTRSYQTSFFGKNHSISRFIDKFLPCVHTIWKTTLWITIIILLSQICWTSQKCNINLTFKSCFQWMKLYSCHSDEFLVKINSDWVLTYRHYSMLHMFLNTKRSLASSFRYFTITWSWTYHWTSKFMVLYRNALRIFIIYQHTFYVSKLKKATKRLYQRNKIKSNRWHICGSRGTF